MIKFFKKSQKLYIGIVLGPFGPSFDKNEFSQKKGIYQFLNILSTIAPKIIRKLMSHS